LKQIAVQDSSAQSKQLLNDVIFIRFIDKTMLFRLATLKNSLNDRQQASGATKNNDIGAKRCLCTVRRLKSGYTSEIFVDMGAKVDGTYCQYYCDLLLSQQLLPVIAYVMSLVSLYFRK